MQIPCLMYSLSRHDARWLDIPDFDCIVVACRCKHNSGSMGESDRSYDIEVRLEAFPRGPNPFARFRITLHIIVLGREAQICQLVLVTLFVWFAHGIANLELGRDYATLD